MGDGDTGYKMDRRTFGRGAEQKQRGSWESQEMKARAVKQKNE